MSARILCFFTFFFTFSFLKSQTNIDSIQAFHQANLESIVLLKNDEKLVPFKDLTKHIVYLSLGEAEKTKEFEQLLQAYTTIKSFNLPFEVNGDVAGEVYKYALNYGDIIIIAINENEVPKYGAALQDFTEELAKKVPIVYSLFGSKQLISNLPNIELATALLYTSNQNEYSQSLAGQICFGGIGAIGKLSENLTPYAKGTGIKTEGGLRLGYVQPALVGVDQTYLTEKIEAIMQEGLDSMAFPGAQVLVAKSGKVIYQQNFGFHTYDKQQSVRLTDIYDLASVTKVTTAVPALMRMQDDGLFNVEAKVIDYFSEFKKSNKADLKFRDILAHNARLLPYIVYWQKAQKKNGKFKARTFKKQYSKRYPIKITDQLFLHKKYKRKIMHYIKKSPLNKEAGYVYSGLTFLMYPDLVKNKTGKRLDYYLYDTFYKPLGANRLLFNPLERVTKAEIIPTEDDDFFRKQLIHGRVHDEAAAMLSGISTNAGLFGNANDLAKLLQLYLNKGTYGGMQFIDKSTVQDFTQCQFCDEGNRRGLGFDKPLIEYDVKKSYVAQSASKESYGHSGFTGTFFWVDPAKDLIVIFLSNRVHPTRNNRKLYTMDIRPRIHQAAYDAISEFDNLKKQEMNKGYGKE